MLRHTENKKIFNNRKYDTFEIKIKLNHVQKFQATE